MTAEEIREYLDDLIDRWFNVERLTSATTDRPTVVSETAVVLGLYTLLIETSDQELPGRPARTRVLYRVVVYVSISAGDDDNPDPVEFDVFGEGEEDPREVCRQLACTWLGDVIEEAEREEEPGRGWNDDAGGDSADR